MRFAVPVANGVLCAHFGHAPQFVLIDADPESRKILGQEVVEAPEHQPGLLPSWLAERGAKVILAGGMGTRARELFAVAAIRVVTGVPAETPERLVADFLAGTLRTGENVCDH